jgi:two-component system phosphate regulon response regulator PhoB
VDDQEILQQDYEMAEEKILVVDDDEDILKLLQFNLLKEGFRVSCAASGEVALQMLQKEKFDLIILDIMLPGIDGFEVARLVRNDYRYKNVPILMVTAKTEEADIVAGLTIGADDYVTKPFSPRVLVARIKVLLRRGDHHARDNDGVIQVHDVAVHPKKHKVLVNKKPVTLTLTEFGILLCLMKTPGWVYTRSQIINAVHGTDFAVSDRSVDAQIAGLRSKLGPARKYIETVRGVGYRFRE